MTQTRILITDPATGDIQSAFYTFDIAKDAPVAIRIAKIASENPTYSLFRLPGMVPNYRGVQR